ncbi:uncharacterized protein F5Z01DRAFT_262075 [Emericellopsis atlantica]|uniref:Uncharacterized protein n=1 Tax=Emericellopsis atlantica TaxID=2614577 RepID=A0A9P7ZHB7_9HYPO|nr:uncharacterized protein F5Z01DRAFT_262075 [Emericellopsis atlantica]KAG9251702.1 hypothetical protein F5Z01DRAFT_262075 [Emericellopsis atlantica]
MADRPAMYFHLEMGVSWRPRKHQGQSNHQLTLMSKSARERANNVTRHWGPQNANYPVHGMQPQRPYLIQQTSYDHNGQPYTQQQQWQHQQPAGSHAQWPHPTWQTHAQAAQPAIQYHTQPWLQSGIEQEQQRPSRPRSPTESPHGRNRSAPPPMSAGSWDAEPEPMMATALPQGTAIASTSKPLPSTPAQYRLGHDDMPWSPSPFPMGRSDDGSSEQSPDLNDTQNPATAVPSSSPAKHVDDRVRGRTKEMQSLATAMMTVDNGFEDQWWYQGERLVNIAGDLISPAEVAQRYAPGTSRVWQPTTPGMAGLGDGSVDGQISASPSLADVVSPVSDYSSPRSGHGSPGPIKRSMTTRSDEMFMR